MRNGAFPESVWPAGRYPFLADLKLNLGALVAVAVAIASRAWLAAHPDGGRGARALVALLPLVPTLFWVARCGRWLRTMDELQQRIQSGAIRFATVATLFVVTGLGLLAGAGILDGTRWRNGLGWEGTFALVVVAFMLGNLRENRRFR